MEGIDPRLRDAAPQHYEQAQRTSSDLNGVPDQGPEYDGPSQAATQSQIQQQQYYSVHTPTSHSSGAHQDTAGSPYEGHHAANGVDLGDLKRPRACEACRQLKVRCDPTEGGSTGSCRRCLKANRPCVVTAPSRKRQKKTDTRVADLEKKIDALTASLHANRGPFGGANQVLDPAIAQAQMADLEQQRNQLYHPPSWQDGLGDPSDRRETNHNTLSSPALMDGPPGSKRKCGGNEGRVDSHVSENGQQPWKKTAAPSDLACCGSVSNCNPAHPYTDVIYREIVDAQTAYRIFDRYHEEMRLLPIVVFRPGTKAEDVRRSKPILFLAVLTAASSTIRSDLQSIFLAEIMSLLADRIVRHGEKSFELVQSLQIITIFYQPPERYVELNFNQLIHIAAVMGYDLGMGKRTKSGQGENWVGKTASPEPDAAETRRSWLGLYYMCANAAMSLRRPLLVRWSPYMDESLEILTNSPDALPSDKWLVHLVRAQHIAEEVGYQFSMDDAVSDISITDPKIQYQIKTFERQLDEWRRTSTSDMPQGVLHHNEAIMDLYVHEIAMHHAHNVDDFRPPYGVDEVAEDQPDYITPAHIHSLTICLDSIHKAFDAFIHMPLPMIQALPTLFFVRNSYAAVALIKMYNAVSRKGSKFGSVFKPKDLKVEYYLDALLETSRRAGEGGMSRVAMKFIFIFGMLREWQVKRVAGALTTSDRGMFNVKNITAGWDKTQPMAAGGNLQPQTNSNTGQDTTGTGSKAQHSGLQMLSEVAMGNDKKSNSTSNNLSANASAAAAAPAAAISTSNYNANGNNTNRALAPWDPQQQHSSSLNPEFQSQSAPQHQEQQQQQQQQQASQFRGPSTATTTTEPGQGSQSQPQQYHHQPNDPLLPLPDMDNLAFTVEELGALGTIMDNPGWLSFGLEGGGWVM